MRWQKLAKQRKFLVFCALHTFEGFSHPFHLVRLFLLPEGQIQFDMCVRARACCCCCLWVCGYIEFRVPNTSYLCVIRRSFNICSFLTVVVCTCSIQFSCYISFHFKCIYFPRSVFININLVIVK